MKLLNTLINWVFAVAIIVGLVYWGLAEMGLALIYRTLIDNPAEVLRQWPLAVVALGVPLVLSLVIWSRQRRRYLAGTWNGKTAMTTSAALVGSGFGALIILALSWYPFIGDDTSPAPFVTFVLITHAVVGTLFYCGLAWWWQLAAQWLGQGFGRFAPRTKAGWWGLAAGAWIVGAFFLMSLVGAYMVSHTFEVGQWLLGFFSILIVLKAFYWAGQAARLV
jgi:hypothetical protein